MTDNNKGDGEELAVQFTDMGKVKRLADVIMGHMTTAEH